jgi:hypothetical protein
MRTDLAALGSQRHSGVGVAAVARISAARSASGCRTNRRTLSQVRLDMVHERAHGHEIVISHPRILLGFPSR